MWRFCVAATAIVSAGSASAGSTLVYQFWGEVTSTFSLRNDYVGIEEGDQFFATVTINGGVTPTQDGPDRRAWDRDAFLLFQVTVQGRIFDYFIEPSSTGEVVVVDNQDLGGFATRDEFSLSMGTTRLGGASISFVDDLVGSPDNPIIDGLSLPRTNELDPMLFQDAEFSLGGLSSTGFVDGRITRAFVTPTPASALVFAGLGLARRRR